jgi:Spy/CpxP family protein refolding chaperone
MSVFRIGLVLCAILATVSSVSAQRPGGGRFGEGRQQALGGAMLLRQEAVQEDLGLTDDQKQQLRRLAAGQQRGGDRPNLRDMSQEERREWMAEMRERMEAAEKKMSDILTEEQRTRLKQIRLQVMGPAAVGEPEFAKELGLTDEQREKIGQLRERVRQAREDGSNDETLRERMANAVKDMLTPEQREKLETLRGKPFDTSSLMLGGRRRE